MNLHSNEAYSWGNILISITLIVKKALSAEMDLSQNKRADFKE